MSIRRFSICGILVLVLLLSGCGGSNTALKKQAVKEGILNLNELDSRNIDSSIDKPYKEAIKSISDKGIEIYWKKPEHVDGFEVYRSYEEETGYELLFDIVNEVKWSYHDDSFDHDKRTVYYVVCSFVQDENGNKTYSEFSKVLSANYRDEFKINRKKYFLASGSSRKIKTFYGWGNAKNVEFTSSDEKVATVSEDGLVTGVSKGECDVTCHHAETDAELVCHVTIDRDAPAMLQKYDSRYKEVSEDYWVNENAEATGDAVIMMVGDLMCMDPHQKKMRDEDGNFNFNECYDYIAPVFKTSDYMIGNLETLLDPAFSYSCDESTVDSFPHCNAPPTFLDALKYAGVDGVATADNHNCDAGVHGVTETIRQCERYEIGNTGLFLSKDDNRTLIADVNGIKVGFLAYATEYNTKDSTWNQDDLDTYLNTYSEEKAIKDVKTLKQQGAEYIMVYMHWGTQNNMNFNEKQTKMAKELAEAGVDYICGCHPHVLQPFDEIVTDSGKVVPIIYSLGNLNGSVNQVPGNRDGVVFRIRLHKEEDGTIKLVENNYIPTFTYTEYKGKNYVTMPICETFNDKLDECPGYKEYRERIKKVLGDKITEYTE